MAPSYKSHAFVNCAPYLLDRHVEGGGGHRPALRYEGESFSYSDTLGLACKAGDLFTSAGLDYENRVLMILPDSPLSVAALFGAMRVGAVPVPVSTRLSADEYRYIFADCRPAAAVVGPQHLAAVEKIREEFEQESLPFPRNVWVAGGGGDLPRGFADFEEGLRGASADCPVRPTHEDDVALIQYTSGSTGIPKGVVHLHRGVIEVTRGFPERLRLGADDLCFSVAKLSFGYGFGNSVLFPFSRGACSILYPGLVDPFNVLDILTRLRPTVFFGIPSMYAAILEVSQGGRGFDLSGVRLCVSAGEHLSAELFRRWRAAFGHEIVDGIGSTECLHVFISGEPGRVRPGSTGTPVAGYEVRLVDERGREVAPGEVGELHVKSECNAARYWNKQRETRATMLGAWTRTGDFFRREGEYFYFVGRADDVIKVRGSKVSPLEIEERLLTHEAVKECGVVGEAGEDGITSVVAYVRLNDGWEGGGRLSRELKDHVRGALSPHKCPRRIEFIAEMPKTATGKIARHRLRSGAGAGRPAALTTP